MTSLELPKNLKRNTAVDMRVKDGVAKKMITMTKELAMMNPILS